MVPKYTTVVQCNRYTEQVQILRVNGHLVFTSCDGGWEGFGVGGVHSGIYGMRGAGLVVVVQVSVEDPDVLVRLVVVVVAVKVVVVVVVDDAAAAAAAVGDQDLLGSAGGSAGGSARGSGRRLAPAGAAAAAAAATSGTGSSGSGCSCLLPPAAGDGELRPGAARAGPTLAAVDGHVAGLTDGGRLRSLLDGGFLHDLVGGP